MSTPNTPQKSFDRAVSYYDETRGFPPGVEARAAALISQTAGLTPASRVFEVGIGTGRIALPLLPFSPHLFGLDVSRGMMAVLRGKPGGAAIHLAQGNAQTLPFPSRTFDACIASHIFHLVDDPAAALDETRRILKAGAPLVSCMSKNGKDKLNFARESYTAAASVQTASQGGAPAPSRASERGGDILAAHGWQMLGEEASIAYKTSTTPRKFTDQFERRVYSSQWGYTDEGHARGMAALRAAIAEKFARPDEVVESEAGFAVQLYLPRHL